MSVEQPNLARCRTTSPWLLAAVALLVGGQTIRADTPPTKPRNTRKTFDFTRPRPGEMLANPAKGAGAPPQLKEFAPNEAMHISQSETADAASPANGKPQSKDEEADRAMAGARSAAAGPAVQPNAAQKALPEQIARLGIEGFLSQPPQAASEQEQKDEDALRKQIAASLAIWQELYGKASAASAGDAPAAPVKSEPKP